MSIVTEISRIKSAKSSIAAAIAGKGVTVPDGTMLDGMAALIEAIEAGGMKTIFNHKFEYGSITPAEDITSDYTITFHIHDSNAIQPYYYFYLFHDALNGTPNNSWLWLTFGRVKDKWEYSYGQSIDSNGSVSNQSYSGVVGSGSTYKFECTVYCTTSKKLVAGEKYNWIKINVKEA